MIDVDALRETLRNRPRTLWLEHIAADIDVSLTWMKEFSRGYAPAKETRAIRALARYFAERDV